MGGFINILPGKFVELDICLMEGKAFNEIEIPFSLVLRLFGNLYAV